jgi:hypothetical protein
MKSQRLDLRPFAPPPSGPFALSVRLARDGRRIAVSYELRGTLRDLSLPAPALRPERRTLLWEETCFELFLAPRGASSYWEFNLSPAGHWNVFRFSGYRQGREEEPAFRSLPLDVLREGTALRLRLEIEPAVDAFAEGSLEAGLTAVLRDLKGDRTYWALAHAGETPDFHRRESFTARLEAPG